MDLFEYQAKELFKKHGVPVSLGEVATTPAEAKAIAERIGGVTVVKAQVKIGGRGKAGGVKVAKTPDDAKANAEAILGMDIKGHTVHRVLVDPGADIQEEYYVSFLLDRANRTFLAMASYEGGMEIEQLAHERPDALAKVPVDANAGVDLAKGREIAVAAKFPADLVDPIAAILVKLWDVFVNEDATLVEVNPLAKVGDGEHRSPSTARSRSTRTPTSVSPSTRRWWTTRPPTRSRRAPRRRTSTTSSSTARSGSSATARVSSCPPSTSSPTPVRSTAA